MSQVSIEGDGHLNRLINNFFQEKAAGEYDLNSLNAIRAFTGYMLEARELKKFKVAMLFICLNEPYWQYIEPVIQGAKQFFLPGHQVDYFLWSDIPQEKAKDFGVTLFPTEPIEWPYPTLWRFHLFTQQVDKLKDYDYVFYCDADMKFVNIVGDEILGEGLTAAQHPMYAFKDSLYFPYESNPQSTAYIKRPGMFGLKNGQNFFQPFYYAGGFQGGKTKDFMTAAEKIKEMIDQDEKENHYIARWNDESYWNKYLADTPPSKILTPSYIYPDSMIDTYYLPIWGKNYSPKLVTLTKPFALQKLTPEEMKARDQRGI